VLYFKRFKVRCGRAEASTAPDTSEDVAVLPLVTGILPLGLLPLQQLLEGPLLVLPLDLRVRGLLVGSVLPPIGPLGLVKPHGSRAALRATDTPITNSGSHSARTTSGRSRGAA